MTFWSLFNCYCLRYRRSLSLSISPINMPWCRPFEVNEISRLKMMSITTTELEWEHERKRKRIAGINNIYDGREFARRLCSTEKCKYEKILGKMMCVFVIQKESRFYSMRLCPWDSRKIFAHGMECYWERLDERTTVGVVQSVIYFWMAYISQGLNNILCFVPSY